MPCLPNLGSKAPDFTVNTTFGSINLSDYCGKWVVLFSHPGDFTPVCTTEFICFAKYYNEFKKRNTQLIGLSVDSNASHLAWVYNICQLTGIEIPFPIPLFVISSPSHINIDVPATNEITTKAAVEKFVLTNIPEDL